MREIVINIKNTAIVQPSQKSSKDRLWLSNVDLVVSRLYSESIHIYKSNGDPGFFDPNLLKEALGKALIPFYPVAGRLSTNPNDGRIEIDCNNEGVLFLEAETTSALDDFGDFSPTVESKKLVPRIDYSAEISSRPLLLVQLTRYKCGGISLGLATHHLVADGFSVICFINSWARLARGVDLASCRPHIDRTVLRAQDPPSSKFYHVEYEPFLAPRASSVTLDTRTFNITRDQINTLKANSKQDGNTTKDFTSFEILSGHIWRSVCKARGLSDARPSKAYVGVDARSRLVPKLPPMYFGNGAFLATPVASIGDLVSNPASYAASKVRESVARMDDEYLRSAIDYIELHPDKEALIRGSHSFESPNLAISSVAQLPLKDADFGWGRPAFVKRGWAQREGFCFLTATETGSELLITLEDKHMQPFESYLYLI